MRRYNRWARAAKWTGAAALIAIAAIWFASGWWGVLKVWPAKRGYHQLSLSWGRLGGDFWFTSRGQPLTEVQWVNLGQLGRAGWEWKVRWRHHQAPPMPSAEFYIPLWLPWVILLVPTLWFWRLDRRLSDGQCRACGYDLTGITTDLCPECGEHSPAAGAQ